MNATILHNQVYHKRTNIVFHHHNHHYISKALGYFYLIQRAVRWSRHLVYLLNHWVIKDDHLQDWKLSQLESQEVSYFEIMSNGKVWPPNIHHHLAIIEVPDLHPPETSIAGLSFMVLNMKILRINTAKSMASVLPKLHPLCVGVCTNCTITSLDHIPFDTACNFVKLWMHGFGIDVEYVYRTIIGLRICVGLGVRLELM